MGYKYSHVVPKSATGASSNATVKKKRESCIETSSAVRSVDQKERGHYFWGFTCKSRGDDTGSAMRRLGVKPIRGQEAPKEWECTRDSRAKVLIVVHTALLLSFNNILARVGCTQNTLVELRNEQSELHSAASYIPQRLPSFIPACDFWGIPSYPSKSPKAPPGFVPG
jgi:hypothetical protein